MSEANKNNNVKKYKPIDITGFRVKGNELNQYYQYVKNQFIEGSKSAQKVFDRINKKNLKRSYPVAYIQLDLGGLLHSAAVDLATAVGLAYFDTQGPKNEKTALTILNNYLKIVKSRAKNLVKTVLKEVQR